MVRALVKAGANVNVAAGGGVTPLHVAAENGDVDNVKILLDVSCLPLSYLPSVSILPPFFMPS